MRLRRPQRAYTTEGAESTGRTATAGHAETVERVGDGTLTFRLGRRQLLAELVEWSHAAGSPRSKPTRKLTDLADMDAEQLAAVRLRIAPGCTISSRDGWVWAQPPAATDPIALVPTSGPGLCVFNAVNGIATVGQIVDLVVGETGWSDDRAFTFCRSAVLHFVGLRVCIPATRA